MRFDKSEKTVPSGYLGKDLKLFGHIWSNLPKSLCIKQRENKEEYFQSPLTGKENSYGGGKQANTGPGRRPAPQLKGRLEDETANKELLISNVLQCVIYATAQRLYLHFGLVSYR